jgi:hypothetical protein
MPFPLLSFEQVPYSDLLPVVSWVRYGWLVNQRDLVKTTRILQALMKVQMLMLTTCLQEGSMPMTEQGLVE